MNGKMRIGILGIPFNGDGTRPETENPASALRQAGLSSLQARIGGRLQDYGDLEVPVPEGIRDARTQVLNLEAWQRVSRQAAKKLRSIQKETDFVIILGGDCSILLGVFGAFYLSNKRIGLISLDGHTDYRDPSSSSTGEPADLELAMLTGRGPHEVTGLFGSPPLLRTTDVVVCGFREPDLIAESDIPHFRRSEFRKTATAVLANQALARLRHLDRLWFHFDVDVLDPTIMPVLFPEPDGLGIDESLEFLSTAIRSKKITGMSIACYHPKLDPERKAATMIVNMIGSALSSLS